MNQDFQKHCEEYRDKLAEGNAIALSDWKSKWIALRTQEESNRDAFLADFQKSVEGLSEKGIHYGVDDKDLETLLSNVSGQALRFRHQHTLLIRDLHHASLKPSGDLSIQLRLFKNRIGEGVIEELDEFLQSTIDVGLGCKLNFAVKSEESVNGLYIDTLPASLVDYEPEFGYYYLDVIVPVHAVQDFLNSVCPSNHLEACFSFVLGGKVSRTIILNMCGQPVLEWQAEAEQRFIQKSSEVGEADLSDYDFLKKDEDKVIKGESVETTLTPHPHPSPADVTNAAWEGISQQVEPILVTTQSEGSVQPVEDEIDEPELIDDNFPVSLATEGVNFKAISMLPTFTPEK